MCARDNGTECRGVLPLCTNIQELVDDTSHGRTFIGVLSPTPLNQAPSVISETPRFLPICDRPGWPLPFKDFEQYALGVKIMPRLLMSEYLRGSVSQSAEETYCLTYL